MATKEILFSEEARKAIKDGVDLVANAVKVSLGARGRNVVIGGRNQSTKDGYSISKAIVYTDPVLSVGSEMVKEVAKQTVKIAGDATTTATLLAQAIIHEGFKLLSAGHRGVELKHGIDKAVAIVVDELELMKQDAEIGSDKLMQVATISGNNDEAIGSMVIDAFNKTGKEGVISLDDSKTGQTYLDLKDGLVFDKGYLSALFINNQANLSCQLDNPYIIIVEGKVSHLKEINPIFQIISKENKEKETNRPILMIAEDFDGEALYTINVNRVKNGFPVCLVKAPGFGDNQKNILKDIAAVVGANIANDEGGIRLDKIKLEDLGTAEKVLCTKEETTMVGGGGKKHDLDERISFVRKSIELCDPNDFMGKRQLEERLAKLTGGVAIIYVGAATETELNELKDRYDDSLRATRCAIEEGVVVGGGIALIRCIDKLNNPEVATSDELAGVKLIQKVLEYPFIQMVQNAGLDGRVTLGDVLKKDKNFGYNFKTDVFEDLMQGGVVDALKVIRWALINAASFAGTLLTTEVLIIPEKEEGGNNFIPPQMRR